MTLIGHIRTTLSAPRSGRPVCLVCGHGVSPREERLRLSGGVVVHGGCATYEMRRRRVGGTRVGSSHS